MKDAEDLLETCITELLPTCEKVLTTFTAIRDSHEISNIIDDASTSVTREDIEAILPDILKRQTDKNFDPDLHRMIPEFTEFIRIFDQKDKTAADRAFAHSLQVIAVLEAARDCMP